MDPLTAVVMAAIALAYPTGIGGIYFGAQWLETRRVARTKRDWAAFAAKHGLVGGVREGKRGFQIAYAGAVRDRNVLLTSQSPAPGGGWTEVRVMLHPPMDLGLVTTLGLQPHADEQDRVAMLFDADVTRLCYRLQRARWTLEDFGVLLRFEMFVPDPMSLGPMVSVAIDLVDAIDARRARIGPAAALADEARAWEQYARSAGFSFAGAPLSMSGTIDGVAVSAFSRRSDKLTYGLGAEARFEAPLGGAVGLAPTAPGALAPWLGLGADHPGTEDWQLDEPAFDAAFIVRARDPARLAAILPPALRAQLLRVHERTPLVLDDLGIRVASAHLPPGATIPQLLRDLADLAVQIESNVRGRTAGPYR